jgi:hypothetical protein
MSGESVTLVNLTPHAVTVFDGGTVAASWAPSGSFARREELVSTPGALLTDQAEVPLVDVAYTGPVADLPARQAGTGFIVSRVLADALRRPDLFFPFGEVRNEQGQIIGCLALGRFPTTGQEDASHA